MSKELIQQVANPDIIDSEFGNLHRFDFDSITGLCPTPVYVLRDYQTSITNSDYTPSPAVVKEHSPAFIKGGLEKVVAGWQTATVEQLQTIADKVKKYLSQLTLADILNNYHEFETGYNYVCLPFKLLTVEFLMKERDGLAEKWSNLLDAEISQFPEELIEDLNQIGLPIFNWFESVLESNDSFEQARATYLIFLIENPLIRIPENVSKAAKLIYEKQEELDKPIILEQTDKTKTLRNLSYFLVETGFAACFTKPNAWAYARHTCQAIMELLKDDYIGPRLGRDLVALASHQSVLFPPQMFFIFENLIQIYLSKSDFRDQFINRYTDFDDFESPTTNDAIVDYYYQELVREILIDYYESGNYLSEDEQLSLSYSISGVNRTYEKPKAYEAVEGPGTMCVLFCGPLGYATLKRERAQEMLGCDLDLITVDMQPASVLETLDNGGRGMFVLNELLDLSPSSALTGNAMVSKKGKEAKSSRHIKAQLPEDQDKVKLAQERKVHWEDNRGSLLYLAGQDLLDHLTWLFSQLETGAVLYLSKGISSSLMVDLVVKKTNSGGLKIVDALPGMSALRFSSPHYNRPVRPFPEISIIETILNNMEESTIG